MKPMHYPSMTQPERRILREKYVAHQIGLCHFCGDSLSSNPGIAGQKNVNWGLFPSGFRNHPVHLHHDHETGMTIGAVHMQCNAVLWQYHGE